MRILPHTQYTLSKQPKGYGMQYVLEYKGHSYTLEAGMQDNLSIYHDKECIYIVSENFYCDYIGLQRLHKDGEATMCDSVFFQAESETKDWLLKISRYPTKIRFMLEYMEY